MLTVEQKKARALGIGGSDAAIAMGLEGYGNKTILDLYYEKVDGSKKDKVNEAMTMGIAKEPVIKKMYESQQKCKVQTFDTTFKHPSISYMLANIDGLRTLHNGDKCIVEFKYVPFLKTKWYDQYGALIMPLQYLIQCLHYCVVLDAPVFHLVSLFKSDEEAKRIRIFDVKRKDWEKLEAKMLEKQAYFWDCVTKKTPPETSIKTLSLKNIRELEATQEDALCADSALLSDYQEYKRISQTIKNINAERDEIKKRLCYALKDHTEMVDDAGKKLCTFNATKPRTKVDLELLKTQYPEVFESVAVVQKPSRQLRVY